MKTATITFHSAENYGAFFQAYALQQFIINDLEADNKILNFISDKMEEHYQILKIPSSFQDLLRDILMLPFFKKIKTRKLRFKRDQDKYLKTSPLFRDRDGYNKIIGDFDLCIAGSDQIWNLESDDFSELFFLPMAKRKISYAASAGVVLKEEWKQRYKQYLNNFEKVCVRELYAAEYFDSLLLQSGKTETCIDPTFLLGQRYYRNLAGNDSILDKPYIVYYSINNSPESMKLAAQIGRETGIPVIAIYSRMTSIFAWKYGLHTFFEAGPCEFLNLLQHSQCVLTNSFHGTALSIILHKTFMRIGEIKGVEKTRDDRIDSLLEITGLQNRSIWSFDDYKKIKLNTINWEYVDEKIDVQVKHAKKYLSHYIK